MKMRSVTPMRIAKIGYIVMSLIFCAAGILFISLPELSESVIGICIGITVSIFGIVKLVGYFSKDLFRLAFQFDLEFGILMLILGAVILMSPKNLMTFICISLGIAILLDGLFKIRIAFDSKQFGIKDWIIILVIAIVTGLVGCVLIFNSVIGAKILTVLLGVSLLSEGILNLCTVVSTVRIIKNQHPDVIKAEFYEISGKDR